MLKRRTSLSRGDGNRGAAPSAPMGAVDSRKSVESTRAKELVLGAKDVSVALGGRPVLHKMTIELRSGELLGLIGPSGVGKTTLARVLAGRVRPDTGTVTLNEAEVSCAKGSRCTDIAMVSQHPRQACNERWSLWEVIAEPLRIAGELDSEVLEAKVQDCARRARLESGLLARRPGEVSDGQLQRACLARALAQDPRFLICDEVTSMSDPVATAKIVGLLRDLVQRGTGVLFISHDHRLLQACADRIVSLR